MGVVCSELSSPVGRLLIAERDDCLVRISFTGTDHLDDSRRTQFAARMRDSTPGPENQLSWQADRRSRVHEQLDQYFAGARQTFTMTLDPGGTPFQAQVWRALRERVPYGQTRSYGRLAQLIGQPRATRAVARANNQNPIPIVIPCHRIIGSDGSLTGFGGGLATKRALLDLEARIAGAQPLLPFG